MMNKAFILINCDPGSEKSLIEELKHLNGVKEVHGTLGEFDIIAEIESEKPEKPGGSITDFIKKLEHIKSIKTLTSAMDTDLSSQIDAEIPDILPDVIPEEKRPLEPPVEINEEDEDDHDEDFSQKKKRYKDVYKKRYREKK